ncbi:hypothetical protein GCM10023155_30770 [Bremerella cremea]
MDEFVWEPWNHRSATCGGGALARLIWAAMGVVEQATPGKAALVLGAYMFPQEKNHLEVARVLVWDQSARAIQMIAHDNPEVPQAPTEAFTHKACNPKRPLNCEVESRVEWVWNELVYEVATLRTLEGFYFEFTDSTVDGSMFSGPFASMKDVNDHMDLLRHQPKDIRIMPVEHDE